MKSSAVTDFFVIKTIPVFSFKHMKLIEHKSNYYGNIKKDLQKKNVQ